MSDAGNSQRLVVRCPICGEVATNTVSQRGVRHDCATCRTRSWDGKPMVTRATLKARTLAHNSFDPLWRLMDPKSTPESEVRKLLARTHADELLAFELGVYVRISDMDEATAARVPAAVERIRAKLALRSDEEITRDYQRRGREISFARRKKQADDNHYIQ